MEKFVSENCRDHLRKKERIYLVIYGVSAALLLAGILALIFTHTLATSTPQMIWAIVLGVLLALWSVFFWDYLFRKNHAYLRLQTLSLYAKVTLLKGEVRAEESSLYQGYLPLKKLTIAYHDKLGPHQTSLYALADYPWQQGKTYTFAHYDNLITGVESLDSASEK